MKKLITILTTASFSLVPTINIIACQNKSEEEIVGETIEQEILDSAIDEMNSILQSEERIYLKWWMDDLEFNKIVPETEKKPEFIVMAFILSACLEYVNKNDNSNINRLNLKLDGIVSSIMNDLLKYNLKKFKVIPVESNWLKNVEKIVGKDENSDFKFFRFRIKFEKTLSNKAIECKMFWDIA